jgi:YD repeat-containing protein
MKSSRLYYSAEQQKTVKVAAFGISGTPFRAFRGAFRGHHTKFELSTSVRERRVIAAFKRDALQRETLRGAGALRRHSAWDSLSRLKARSSIAFKGDKLPTALTPTPIKKAYGYDKNGELTGRNDNFSGERRYRYDAVGRITGASSPNATRAGRSQELRDALAKLHDREAVETAMFSEESFAYDTASNLMATGTDDWKDWQNIGPREVRGSDFGGRGFGDDGFGHARHNRLTELNG